MHLCFEIYSKTLSLCPKIVHYLINLSSLLDTLIVKQLHFSRLAFYLSDIEVSSFAFVYEEDLQFDLDVDNIYEISITLRNSGGSISSITVDQFNIYFVVSDTNDLDNSTAVTLWTAADTSETTGTNSGTTLVITDVFAMINVPKADCGSFTHFCIYVNGTSGADFSDSDSSNDYACIEAFGTENADYLPCSGKNKNKTKQIKKKILTLLLSLDYL